MLLLIDNIMYDFLKVDNHFLLPYEEGSNFDLVKAVQCKTLDTFSVSVTRQMVHTSDNRDSFM